VIYRVYFNSSKDAPFIWSFDSGSSESEVLVKNAHFAECHAWTHYDPKAGDNKNTPTAWINVLAGYVEIVDDEVYFTN
jgi:hypothetical protein